VRDRYDVVVIGGGPAGLSAATALGRSRRSVLVIDSGEPRNAPAAHAHNVFTRDGTPPLELLAAGRAEVLRYGGEIEPGAVVDVRQTDDAFVVGLADGRSVAARHVVSATGLRDVLPNVPGLAERWGKDVLHCPYCHGWEVRDQPLGVLGAGPLSLHTAHLFRQLTADVTVFVHTDDQPPADAVERLAARGIALVHGEVVGVETAGDELSGVRLATGETVAVQALAVRPQFLARAEHLAGLELHAEPVEHQGQVMGAAVPADPRGATRVSGIWVAGNVTDLGAQVVGAADAGLMTGAAVNAALVAEDTDAAVRARHVHTGHSEASHGPSSHGHSPQDLARMFDVDFWEERYSGKDPAWSGRANVTLVAEVSGLTPGRALEVAAGEGGDALWLAEQGWRVTATDFAAAGLARGAAQARERGVADRVVWRQADIAAWTGDETYDLVTSHYLHPAPEQRAAVTRTLASLVGPGGHLLIVGHHVLDLATTMPRPDIPELFTDADELLGHLDATEWDVLACEARPRDAVDPEGRPVVLHEAVLHLRRR